MKINFKIAIIGMLLAAIVLRLILLVINPISMFADAIIRYIPQSEQVLQLNFNFHDLPLLPLLLCIFHCNSFLASEIIQEI